MIHILYNTLAAHHHGEEQARVLKERFRKNEIRYVDLTRVENLQGYLDNLCAEDCVIVAGGDGTLHRFVNAVEDKDYPFPIYSYPAGSGNDFYRDTQDEAQDGLVLFNPYMKNLPRVRVGEKEYKFINGVGYGIDGYCCEIGDKMNARSDKPVNYAGIAIRGLLFHFKPRNATVTVDGKTRTFGKVWLAPTMNGRYYGGGMKVAPAQDRLNPERKLTLIVMHGSGKLKTLAVFPSIFKGEHVRHKEMVEVLEGRQITVRFDEPTALQIDGETKLGVTEYTAVCCAHVRT